MRLVLFGLNVATQAAAVTPAVIIFQTVRRAHELAPLAGQTFFALLGGGSLMCLTAAAALTKRHRPNPRLAARLLSFSGLLFSGAIAWAVAVFEAA